MNPLLPKLTQSQPELENLRGATALQTEFTAMGCGKSWFHVGKSGVECLLERRLITDQQQ